MKPTWLYIKQHNDTGLKYFGKTVQDPHKYKGSGVYWTAHLNKHGNNVTTTWCQMFTDEVTLVEYATQFSKTHNIVESKEWANMCIEDGKMGGNKVETMSNAAQQLRNYRIANTLTQYVRTSEHIRNLAEARKGTQAGNKNSMFGKKHKESTLALMRVPKTGATIQNMSAAQKERQQREQVQCEYCGKVTNVMNNKKWHGANCKGKN